MTDIPEDEWRYSINYGPEGEANYAFVYDGGGHLVSNLKIHHAIAVVEQMNARAAQAERIRELEDVRDFVARWAWRTDPPNASRHISDSDRLSCIKHHPTIKKAAQPHIELAEAEAARSALGGNNG